ncbi:MAG: hypothetical protein RR358_05920 [Cetobacterium sp.]
MDIIKVDFNTKQVIEEPACSLEEVTNAIVTLKAFIDDNFRDKELSISSGLQVLMHDIEDASDEQLEEDSVNTLKRIRLLRKKRREIKNLSDLKKSILNIKTASSVITTLNCLVESKTKKYTEGSTHTYYTNTLNRKAIKNKTLIKNSRL